MKYRVENAEELEKIKKVLNYKLAEQTIAYILLGELKIEDSDIQIIKDVIVITGTIDTNTLSRITGGRLPIDRIEIEKGILKISFNCLNGNFEATSFDGVHLKYIMLHLLINA